MEYLYAIALDLVLIWVPSKSHDQTRSSDSPEYNGPTPCSHLPSPLAPWINNQPDLWWCQIFRGMFSLTSRCFCSCLSCLPYSERARVRCLGLHSRNPAVEHFQERQWIQPPWNIALKIWSSNIYSILYMANNIHICIWPCSSFWTCSPTWHSSPSDPTRCSALPHTWVFHLILIEERLVKLVQWLMQYFMVFSLTRISALGWWSLRGRYEQVLSKIFKPWKFPLIPFFRQQINWINQVLVPLAGLIRAVMLHEFYCNCWRFRGFTLIFMDMIDYKIYVHDWLYQYSEKYRNLEKRRILCACSNWSFTHARTCGPQNMKRGGT